MYPGGSWLNKRRDSVKATRYTDDKNADSHWDLLFVVMFVSEAGFYVSIMCMYF